MDEYPSIMKGRTWLTLPTKIDASRLILFILFVLLGTVFSAVAVEGKNALYIISSVIGSIALLILNRKFPFGENKIVIALLLILTTGFLVNLSQSDFFSYVYSVFFVCSYLIFISFFKQKFNPNSLQKIAFFVMGLYLILLLIGQAYVLLGFFRGTHISKGLLHGPFGTLYEAGGGFRYYSLSTEPSYAAFIVICLLYIIVETEESKKLLGKKMMVVWLMAIYMLFSFQSSYGILLLFTFIIFKIMPKNKLLIIGLVMSLAIGAFISQQSALTRVINLISNFKFDQIERIGEIDHSAKFRILPTYYYLTEGIKLNDPHFYFGHGAGQSSDFLIPYLFKSEMESYEGGFLPMFLYDYGIIFGVIFFFFLTSNILTKFFSFETFAVILMMTNANFNTQLFWFVIISFALIKSYKMSSLVVPGESN